MRPQTKEEAWALIEQLIARTQALHGELEDVRNRLLKLEGKKLGKKSRSAEQVKTAQNILAELWTAAYRGRPPAFLFNKRGDAMAMISEYGLDRVGPVLAYYFAKTPCDLVSLPKLRGSFPIWEERSKGGGQAARGSVDAAGEGMAMARRIRAQEAKPDALAVRGDAPGWDGPADRGPLPR